MDKVQKKLVQGAFKLWESTQADERLKFYNQEIPDIGYVAATPHVLIRVPLGCPQPFQPSREDVRIRKGMLDLITGDKAEMAFDTGETKTVNRNTVVKKIAHGTEGSAVFVAKAMWSYVPSSVKYIDVYDNRVVRVYVAGEELPVVLIARFQERGVK